MDSSSGTSGSASEECLFCKIARGASPASIVYEDELTMAFIDLRQFHPGHTLVIPKKHLPDVRDLDPETGAALMATVTRVTRAVGGAFPNDGFSLWIAIGPGAYQEVPHLHIHIHPRMVGDGFLHVYPRKPAYPDRETLDEYAARIRERL